MKSGLNVIKAIFLGIFVLILGFGIISMVMMFDYVNKCVHITPRDNLPVVEHDKMYCIEDFFIIEREETKDGRKIHISWTDGSSGKPEDIKWLNGKLFTVTGGTGYLSISIEDWNPHSPEGSYGDVTVRVAG